MPTSVTSLIEPTQLTTSAVTLYKSPAGTRTRIDKLLVVNPTGTTATVTIYVVPSGTLPGTANITTSAQAVLAGQSWNSPNEAGLTLAAGDSIAALASAGATLTIFAGGTQMS